MTRAVIIAAAVGMAAAHAQPPASPRATIAPESQAFLTQADAHYRMILSRLSAKGMLDDDAITLRRVRRVTPGLIAAAAAFRGDTAAWPWEIHVTSDPSTGTFCIAGGRILVGAAFVARLALSDAELAMLLAHEMAHAIAGHRRQVAHGGMEADPAQEIREAQAAQAQESEADRIGMALAYRAGWPLAGLVGFFDKLAEGEGAGTFNSTHPQAAARAEAARAMAVELESSARIKK